MKETSIKGIYTIQFHLDKIKKQLKLSFTVKTQAQRAQKVKYFVQDLTERRGKARFWTQVCLISVHVPFHYTMLSPQMF